MTGIETVLYAMLFSKMNEPLIPVVPNYAANVDHRHSNVTVVGQYWEYHEDTKKNKDKKEDTTCGKQN